VVAPGAVAVAGGGEVNGVADGVFGVLVVGVFEVVLGVCWFVC
jgi:hypothetical protein